MKNRLSVCAFAVLGFAVAGCYNPQIPDGTFLCSQIVEQDGTMSLLVCPDGYQCDPACLDPKNPAKTCTCISNYTLNGGMLTVIPATKIPVDRGAALAPEHAAALPANSAAVVEPTPAIVPPVSAVELAR